MKTVRVKDRDFSLLLSEETISNAVKDTAAKINKDLDGKRPLFLAVLNGSFMFASDLMKEISIDCEISFIKLASYQGMESGGKVREVFGLNENIAGRHILIVEDIVDSGRTMRQLMDSLLTRNPADIKIATFLDKPDARVCDITPDYVAIEIPNDFVVGYGLDYDGYGRNLSEVYTLIK